MKYILKLSTTGLNPMSDYIYRVVVKSVETGRVYDKYIKDCPENLIKRSEVLSEDDKKLAIIQKDLNGERFVEVAKVLKKVIEGNEIIGFNVSFDINFLLYRMNAVNVSLNVSKTTIFDLLEKEREQYKFDIKSVYERETSLEYNDSMRFDAAYNVEAFECIYNKLTEISPESKSIWAMNRFIDENGILKTGKYKGISIKDTRKIPADYYRWLQNGDDIIVRLILAKIFPKPF